MGGTRNQLQECTTFSQGVGGRRRAPPRLARFMRRRVEPAADAGPRWAGRMSRCYGVAGNRQAAAHPGVVVEEGRPAQPVELLPVTCTSTALYVVTVMRLLVAGFGLRKRLPVATMSVDLRLPPSVVDEQGARCAADGVVRERDPQAGMGVKAMPGRDRFDGIGVDNDILRNWPAGG